MEEAGPWEHYRERDQIRSGWVTLRGEGAPEEGLRLRAVELERIGSRNPQRTRFATTASGEKLTAPEVVSLYRPAGPTRSNIFAVHATEEDWTSAMGSQGRT